MPYPALLHLEPTVAIRVVLIAVIAGLALWRSRYAAHSGWVYAVLVLAPFALAALL